MRMQKVLEHSWYPETTNYTYHGKLLTHMEVAYTGFDEVSHVDKLHFFYDAQSRPAKVRFNGTIYTYLQNLQGDIVGILDSTGNLVVEYKYDAWGKPLSTTGSLADTLGARNPFRYRGYIYDEESGLYYLKERYYSPFKMRFINADVFAGLANRLLSHNAMVYCENRPIRYKDQSGAMIIITNAEILTENLRDYTEIDVSEDEDEDAYYLIIGGLFPTMNGPANGYLFGYDGNGSLHEAWYDANGDLIRTRHHTTHAMPNLHKNPHDHEWEDGEKDGKRIRKPKKGSKEVDKRFKAPSDADNSSIYWLGAYALLYIIAFWASSGASAGYLPAPSF